MELIVKPLKREFEYNGIALQDPGPEFSVEEVRETMALMYAELTTASIEGPTLKDDTLVYKFVRNVGTKG